MGIREPLDFQSIEEIWNYQLDGTGVTVEELRRAGMAALAGPPRLTARDDLRFPTPSGKIEIDSAVLKEAGLPSLAPFEPKAAPTGDRFTLLFAKTATLARTASP